jgi:hypothetical protein
MEVGVSAIPSFAQLVGTFRMTAGAGAVLSALRAEVAAGVVSSSPLSARYGPAGLGP